MILILYFFHLMIILELCKIEVIVIILEYIYLLMIVIFQTFYKDFLIFNLLLNGINKLKIFHKSLKLILHKFS